jgi:hypothetical protein
MKPKLLLPYRCKLIGLLVFLPSLILGIAIYFYDFNFSILESAGTTIKLETSGTQMNVSDARNYTDELALTGMIIGLLMIAFSRQKEEDEFINKIRLESLQWAILVNYILLIIATWAVYGFDYIDVMIYNMLTVLLIFNIRFHILIWRNNYSAKHPNL